MANPPLLNNMSMEEPEYMDSFYDTLPLVSGRRSRGERPPTLKSSHQNMNVSGRRNALLSLDYNISYRPNLNSILQKGTLSEERCPSCQEVLHCTHSSSLAASREEAQYLNWFVPKPQRRVYLPHYCTFVDTKTLHERGNGSYRERVQQENSRLSQRRVSQATSRQRRHVQGYKTFVGKPASEASIIDTRGMTGDSSPQPSTTSYVSPSQSELWTDALNGGGLSKIRVGAAATDNPSSRATELGERDSKSTSCYNETLPSGQNDTNSSGKNVNGLCIQKSGCQQEKHFHESTQGSHTQEESLQISSEANQIPTTAQPPETILACIPELPNINTLVFDNRRRGSRPNRNQLNIPQQQEKQLKLQLNEREIKEAWSQQDDATAHTAREPCQANDELFTFYQFGDLDSTSERANDAIKQNQEDQELPRMIISVKTVRFELPVDLKSLETLSPQEYVKNHCRMLSLNEKLCLRIFNKHKGKDSTIQGKTRLLNALHEVLFSSISEEQNKQLCDLLEIDDSTIINFKMFVGITAVAERLSCAKVCSKDEAENHFQKDNIETADFHSLDWKLRDIQVVLNYDKVIKRGEKMLERVVISLCKLLNMPGKESSWIMSLQSLETTKDMSRFDSLLMLKSRVLFAKSTQDLRNLVQLFLRNISALIEESDIFSDEKLALQMLNIVKDFWSLLSSQHVLITQQAYGRYSALLYEVLPSLASVYIDLFIAIHSTKSTVDKASKRLYSWLMFELNERCIKTALLEACGCTMAGARLVLPVLRTVLSSPSVTSSNLDYLLHFILLKRWSFICADLCNLIQVSSSIQAPGGFLDWLVQHWPKAVEYLPNDKSLKGRRISEILLELDQLAVEELIDVFSEALSVEQTSEQATNGVNKKSADKTVTGESFFIDKKGIDVDKMQLKTGQQFLQKDEKESGIKKYADISNLARKNKRDSDIFMLSEQIDDINCSKTREEETGNNKDSFMDITVEESAFKQTELHKTVTMQPLNKKKKLSHIEKHRDQISRLSSDYISETQAAVLLGNKDSRDTAFTLAVEAGKDGGQSVDHETHYAWQSAGSKDITAVPESQVRSEVTIHETRSITTHKSAQSKTFFTGRENGCSNNVIPSKNESKTSVKKSKKNPQTLRNHEDLDIDTDDTSIVNVDTPFSSTPQLPVLHSNPSAHSSFVDQIVKKKKQEQEKSHASCSLTETESHEKQSREILDAAQPFENIAVTKVKVKAGSINTEYKVGRMLSAIRKSMSGDRKRKPEDKTDTFNVKTRLRSKSEGMVQSNLHKTRSTNPLITTAVDGFKDWLRQTPNSAMMNQLSPKNLMSENKEQTYSPIKKAKVKDTNETKELPGIFGTPLKTYSRKDRKKVTTHNIEIKSTPESPVTKRRSPKKSSEKSEQRYFLRTNCSHRLLTTDTACPSCSPSTKV